MGPRSKTWHFCHIRQSPPPSLSIYTFITSTRAADHCLAMKHHGMSNYFWVMCHEAVVSPISINASIVISLRVNSCWRRNKYYYYYYYYYYYPASPPLSNLSCLLSCLSLNSTLDLTCREYRWFHAAPEQTCIRGAGPRHGPLAHCTPQEEQGVSQSIYQTIWEQI